jgi:hypothetical protein
MNIEIRELAALLEAEWGARIETLRHTHVPTALTTNTGKDIVSRSMGGGATGFAGTNTATTTTSLTDSGASFPVSAVVPPDTAGLTGQLVIGGTTGALFTYGVIIKSTATVLTVDQWHDPTAPESTRTAPVSTTSPYMVLPGGAPCFYMGITTDGAAASASDVVLASELWTSGGGLRRRLATWAHTTGTNTYTLANTFTANGSDAGLPKVIHKIGVFQAFVNAAVTTSNSGPMLFETVLSADATITISGDNVAITDTITIT